MSIDEPSTTGGSEHRPNTEGLAEHSKQEHGNVHDDETSSSGSSSFSEDDFEEEEDEEQAAHHVGGINGGTLDDQDGNQPSDLRSRLQAFLPKLKKANAELENTDNIEEQRIDHVPEDEERYIEMNLELGVLSERKDGDEDGNVKLREPSEDGDDDIDASTVKKSLEAESHQGVMSQLKGEKPQHSQKRKIEELGSDVGNTNGREGSSSKGSRR